MNITVFENNIAMDYGVSEAIILHCIKYWIDKNIVNNAEMKDGKYWTYNTIKAFTILLPYLSARQVNSALKHLQAEGIIEIGNYNKVKFDRTQWYSITDKGYALFDDTLSKSHFTKTLNGLVENVKPIPISIPNRYTNTNTNTMSGNPDDVSIPDPNSEKNTETTDNAKIVIDYLNSKTKQSYRYSVSSLKHIIARLNDHYTVEDCKQVIDTKEKEWGKKEEMRKYLRPETLFGSKFENYLNQAKQNKGEDFSWVGETL